MIIEKSISVVNPNSFSSLNEISQGALNWISPNGTVRSIKYIKADLNKGWLISLAKAIGLIQELTIQNGNFPSSQANVRVWFWEAKELETLKTTIIQSEKKDTEQVQKELLKKKQNLENNKSLLEEGCSWQEDTTYPGLLFFGNSKIKDKIFITDGTDFYEINASDKKPLLEEGKQINSTKNNEEKQILFINGSLNELYSQKI